ncbi:MAG: hypothetical protein M0005_04675 [Actinomycetota bacterium]|jgi:hypothetical protein|nr:hypothetical protein [Actinomycetota bacterium]
MSSEDLAVTAAYLEHLTDRDLALLTGETLEGLRARELRGSLRSRRGGIEDLLVSPQALEAVFGGDRSDPLLVGVSPFLVFGVAVHQAVRELKSTTYVPDWARTGRATPVFDVARLREFASSPWARFFLAELLASYTRVASGSVVVATPRGLRRHRFSELDPVRMASLLDLVTEAERPGILRRLGDLALFLTGVFPDYLARRGFGPLEEGRLLRAGAPPVRAQSSPRRESPPAGAPSDGALALLDQLGRRWYRAAWDLLPAPAPANVAVLREMPDHFGDARRILGLVTERFLFQSRSRWFGMGMT